MRQIRCGVLTFAGIRLPFFFDAASVVDRDGFRLFVGAGFYFCTYDHEGD